MSNLAERIRTMDRWIRFLNLNHPLGDWGEPAPLPPLYPSLVVFLSLSFRVFPRVVSLTPFCWELHCHKYTSKGLTRANVLNRRRDTLDIKVLRYLLCVWFLCVKRSSIMIELMITFDSLFVARGLQAQIIA